MIIFILIALFLVITLLIHCIFNQQIENYVLQTKQNDFDSIGVGAKSFIGLHIKPLPSEAKLIYVRKTTPYKGLLVFLPDWKYDFHFYLPWLVQLCRSGYIIVTYHSQKPVYHQTPEELLNIIEMIKKDEILSTYPLSILAHGKVGYASLCLLEKLDSSVKVALIGPSYQQIEEVYEYIQNHLPIKMNHFKKTIKKIFEKKYPNQYPPVFNDTEHEIMMVVGKEDPNISKATTLHQTNNEKFHVEILENRKEYPFLNTESEDKLIQLSKTLKDPSLSQFEYNKLLEEFDLTLLYDLDKEVLEMLLNFFES